MMKSSHKKYVLVKSFDFTDSKQREDFFNLISSYPEGIDCIPVMLKMQRSARNIYKLNKSQARGELNSEKSTYYLKIYKKDQPFVFIEGRLITKEIASIAIKKILRLTILKED